MAKRKSTTISASQEAQKTDVPMVSMTKQQFDDLANIIGALSELAAAASDAPLTSTLEVISESGRNLLDEIEQGWSD
ncbi:MAG: hypothetical protein JXP48_13180 [Acidobacteria bacterium]|nr:hypothetical protein [Acidobacteriota bacterium]